MARETLVVLRDRAAEDLKRVVDQQVGIEASGSGRFERTHFGRDADESIIGANEEDQGALTLEIIDASLKTLETQIRYEGVAFNPITGEKKGRKAHEVHTPDSPQDWLRGLSGDPKWAPMIIRYPDGSLSMINYLSDDVTPKHVVAVSKTEEAISRHWGDSEPFLKRHWPSAKRGLLHDNSLADMHNLGLVVSEAFGPLENRVFKDSGNAYVDENGNVPPPPYIYLSVNSFYYWAQVEGVRLAEMAGDYNFSNECGERAEHVKFQINNLFWSKKLNFLVPLIDGEMKQDEIVTDDPVDPLWAQALEYDKARIVLWRLRKPDMLNKWGLYTRSSSSRMFAENGAEAYHNGPNWPKRTKQAAKGAEKYGFFSIARDLDQRAFSLEQIVGRKELVPIARDGETILTYRENGEPVANDPMAWEIFSTLGRTAANLNGNGNGRHRQLSPNP